MVWLYRKCFSSVFLPDICLPYCSKSIPYDIGSRTWLRSGISAAQGVVESKITLQHQWQMFTAGLCNLAFFAFLAMEWTLLSAQLPHPICGHLLCLRREVVNSRPSCGGSTSLVAPFPYKGCTPNQSCGARGRKQLWAWPLLCCCWDNPACLGTPQLPQATLLSQTHPGSSCRSFPWPLFLLN